MLRLLTLMLFAFFSILVLTVIVLTILNLLCDEVILKVDIIIG